MFTRKPLFRKVMLWVFAAALLVAVTARLAPTYGQPAPESALGIVGAWILTDPDNADFTALNTFTPGGEMLVVASAAPAAGGQGVWTKVGHHELLSTFFVIARNPTTGHVLATKKHSQHITLTDEGNNFTARLVVVTCDAAGENCHSPEASCATAGGSSWRTWSRCGSQKPGSQKEARLEHPVETFKNVTVEHVVETFVM